MVADLSKLKTGDLIDAIHDLVCEMGQDGEITQTELDDLVNLVYELKARSMEKASRSQGPGILNS